MRRIETSDGYSGVGRMGNLENRYLQLLRDSSAELFEDNREQMSSGELLPIRNAIDEGDLELFYEGLGAGLIEVCRGGRFNTADRPKPGGRWSLLSRSTTGGWYNAEYLPQLAAYVDAILRLGYPKERVLFELPSSSLQLDLAILDDDGAVVVLGEAKREVPMLEKLLTRIAAEFHDPPPHPAVKKKNDEARQLAWRLWSVRPAFAWLIAPGERDAYTCQFEPLVLSSCGGLPGADERGLAHVPPSTLEPPDLRVAGAVAE